MNKKLKYFISFFIRRREDTEIKEQDYKENIVENLDFIKFSVPKIFKGLQSINLIFWDAYHNDRVSSAKIYTAFDHTNASSSQVGEKKPSEFLGIFTKSIENRIPTYIFVNITKESISEGVDNALRDLKEKYPEVKIFICCSYVYNEEKAEAIYLLIKDGTAEEIKIANDLFDFDQSEKLVINSIQNCLEE